LASAASVVLCMDVGLTMSNSAPGEESSFELAKKVIQKFVQRQVFSETKIELALVLFGTDSTDNPLSQDGQYQNIRVHRHLMIPDCELLIEIENQVQPESQQGDCILSPEHVSLIPCRNLTLQAEGKKYDCLNIALLTDLNTQTNEESLEVIIKNLTQSGITVQFFLPFPVEEDKEGKGLSREQKKNKELVKEMMLSLDVEDGLDEIHTFRNAIEELCMFKRVERRPVAWPCQLTIGSSLSIRIVGYKAVTDEKLKKMWITVDAQSHQKDDVKRETVYCLDDDNETEVQKDDIIQGFRYGSDIVPFSKVDQEQMKYKHDGKCFAVLGFTKQSTIRRNQFMGSQIIKIFAARDDEHAGVALSALIRALNELQMVAIVRYAFNRISNPQVGAAFPCIKQDSECLMYIQLPFMEDLRQFTFPSLENKKFTPSDAQLSAVDSLIDSMMLVEEDENGEQRDLFKPHRIPNPAFQRHFQCLHHRAVSPGTPLPPIEPWLKAALDRPEVITERCQDPLDVLKRKFPLTEVEKKKKLKTSAQIFGKESEESEAKKVKEDEAEEYNLADIAEGSVTSVRIRGRAGRLNNPRRWARFCQQLTHRIEQLLSNKNTQYYMKSITCIQAFREQSVKVNKHSHCSSFGGANDDAVFAVDGLTLISKDEVEGSSVSKAEANQFLVAEEKKEEAAPAPVEDTGDVDDL
uniref:X-ray repair cross-complementing protein 5 n=1 Tax=Maylandia zebra TaxID=106582 RepID=A0A3P9BQH7_9CICH